MVKSCSIRFRLGEKFKEKTMDDRNVDTIFSIDGDVIDDDDEDHDGDGDAKNDVDAAGKRNQKKRKLIQKQVDKVMDYWIRVTG